MLFAIDACDREIMAWSATTTGVSAEMVCDLMIACCERRFGATKTPHSVEWLSDNGSAYIAKETAQTAAALGFDRPTANSLDSVSSRDFALEALSAASITATHLSRLAEEIVLWTTPMFGFIKLTDAFTTGSSIMPQKKNPDAAELARGKAARLAADLQGLLGATAGLPLAYNKDLQDDKHYVFDAADTIDLLLPAMTGMVATADFRADAMTAAAGEGFLAATDLADHLVRLGWPFRRAHEAVGALVSRPV